MTELGPVRDIGLPRDGLTGPADNDVAGTGPGRLAGADVADPGSADPGFADPEFAGAGLADAGLADAGQRSIWPHVEERVLDLIERHRSTIVFANSRRLSERLCAALNELPYERATGQALPPGGAPAELMAQAGTTRGTPPAAPADGGAGEYPAVARAHHGSVSKAERAQIEEALKAGRLAAVGATSHPGLRIDMGAGGPVIAGRSP